jgi:hypothetical protein
MILALIMGCIVAGFTVVTSADSQQNVSNQESNQAYYAAQSGVNDVIQAIKDNLTIPPISSQNCSTIIKAMQTTTADYTQDFPNTISTNPDIAYNCLYVQTTPSNLQFPVSQAQSSVVELDPTSTTGTTTNSLTISWTNLSGDSIIDCTQTGSASLEFVPLPVWDCPYPVLRLDLYQYNPADNTTTAANAAVLLANDTDSFFLFPVDTAHAGYATGSDSGVTFDDIGTNGVVQNQPVVLPANCDGSTCSETLNFPSAKPFKGGYLRITSIYLNAGPVTISGDSTVNFANSQLAIDSTGVDQNVIQRIQVRVPLNTTAGSAPNYAVNAGVSLCKRYSLSGPGSSPNPGLTEMFPLCADVRKPAIYLYPTKTEVVNVKLSYPTGFKQTIPSYNPTSGWTVLAHPSGSLTNLADGKNYPYLFWEGNLNSLNFNMSQGFVIAGSDSAAFLSHELPIIGLNKAETAAFMQYWVPLIDHNKYNLIHFAGSEYTDMAPLDITPSPNSVLRVMMAVEPIKMPLIVTPQSFAPFHRVGFTVVEWGGAILGQ